MFTCLGFTSLKKPFISSSLKNSARVSGQDRNKPPAPRTNQITGFGEFRPLTNLEKKINVSITCLSFKVTLKTELLIGAHECY